MSAEDRRYTQRAARLAPWLWRHAFPVRKWHNRVAIRLWYALLRLHRFAWVRGVEL